MVTPGVAHVSESENPFVKKPRPMLNFTSATMPVMLLGRLFDEGVGWAK